MRIRPIVVAAILVAAWPSHALASDGSTPLVRPAFSPAFVLTDAEGDSLAFETDSLVPRSEAVLGIHSLQYTFEPPHPALFFRIRSTARIAVLVDSAATPAWDLDGARHELLSRPGIAPRYPHLITSDHDAFEYPRDWFRRATLDLDTSFDSPMRVTWIAFDSPDSREIARAAALQSLGLRAAPTGAPETFVNPKAPSKEALRLTARIIGSVRIDPRSGRIER